MTTHSISALRGLMAATDQIITDVLPATLLEQAVTEGVFRPSTNDALGYWFARYLTIRNGLWDVINESKRHVDKPVRDIQEDEEWRQFIIGYSAACHLIRLDRFLLFTVAKDSIVQRKLNEEFAEYRIPRKQFTTIFSAYVNRRDALEIYDAIRHARKNRSRLQALKTDPDLGFLAEQLEQFETWLDPSRRNYLQWLAGFVSHKWRRKGVVALSRSLASVAEGFGRTASELSVQSNKRVTRAVCQQITGILQPGDVIITRHDIALTNLFLPGFWPHAALYIGSASQRSRRGIQFEPEQEKRCTGSTAVLEARKDGVLFRSLSNTLSVDNFVVLRPELSDEDIRFGIERVVKHEGKLYNFDFDFFNSDRLVCTEVVYRAFDGLGGLEFALSERAGRMTLSAEDLIHQALKSDGFQPLAVFGVAGCEHDCVYGHAVVKLLRDSLLPIANQQVHRADQPE